MGWYDDLPDLEQDLARHSPAGLAHIHTQHFARGQRWILFRYLEHVQDRIWQSLHTGGKEMIFAPPRHGKSLLCSVYVPAWYLMFFATRNVIITSYSQPLATGFSKKAQQVVRDLGHIFGIRIHPKRQNVEEWQIQILQPDGETWLDGGEFFAAGVDGALPGRGAGLIVMDDVVRGHKDTTPGMMEKAWTWYLGVLSTREEPPMDRPEHGPTYLLIMTRWAIADIAGRLLEHEADDWQTTILRALAEEDDELGRELGEALCPSRFPAAKLEKRRGSSEEGGILFEALYQQKPMPEGGRVFKAENLLRWEEMGGMVCYGNSRCARSELKLEFSTIDPALKEKEYNDPTGFLDWAIAPRGELIMTQDRTARMRGTTDLIPLLHRLRDTGEHGRNHDYFVEKQAHGTEVIRALQREGFRVLELDADRDKVVRGIQAQPAFAAGKVFLPRVGAENVVRELLENPGAAHDDRWDCVAYGVQVWRDRVRALGSNVPVYAPPAVDKDDPMAAQKDRAGRWKA